MEQEVSDDAHDIELVRRCLHSNTPRPSFAGISQKDDDCNDLATVPLSDSVKSALSVQFPRCCVCGTGWYDAVEDVQINKPGDGNECEDIPHEPDQNDNSSCALPRHKKKRRKRRRPTTWNLFPMPTCQCTTRLALPPFPASPASPLDQDESAKSEGSLRSVRCPELSQADPRKFQISSLGKVSIGTFQNLAICRNCLQKRIDVSNEVQEHDYRDDRPNGQRNVMFTVEPKCVQCQKKFTARVLTRLLEGRSGGGVNVLPIDVRNKKRFKTPSSGNWFEAVDATIQLVGCVKRARCREKRREMKIIRESLKSDNGAIGEEAMSIYQKRGSNWWDQHACCGGDGDGSSEDCYSYSSASEGDDLCYSQELQKERSLRQLRSAPGEILEELMKKDPKFRMEKEDLDYIQKQLRTRDGRLELGLETPMTPNIDGENQDALLAKRILEEEEAEQRQVEVRDRNMAIILQAELDRTIRSELRRKTPRKPQFSSPIIEALKKGSSCASSILSNPSKKASKARISLQNAGGLKHQCENHQPFVDLVSTDKSDISRTADRDFKIIPNFHDIKSKCTEMNTDGSMFNRPGKRKLTDLSGSKYACGTAKKVKSTRFISTAAFKTSRNSFHPSTRTENNLEKDSHTSANKGTSGNIREFMPEPSSIKKMDKELEREPESRSKSTRKATNDVAIVELISMGFCAAAARRSLRDANGDIHLAVRMLLSEASES